MIHSLRTAAGEIKDNYRDPYWIRERVQERIASLVLKRMHGTGGISIPDADWDNLLVYDACRADMFESAIGTGEFDSYRRVTSKGSSSPDWLDRNFAGEACGDIVCVTANPWTARVAGDSFHELVDIWQDLQESGTESEDANLEDRDLSTSVASTVSAEELSEAARDAAERYPDKRLLVHFFQPHAPCIGNPDGSLKSDEELNLSLHPGRPLQADAVDREAVWEAYCDNLRYAHTHGSRLAEELGGKTVFTADHGELFGEWLWPVPMRGYAHPRDLRHPALTEVPWATSTSRERRTIRSGTVTAHESDEDAVQNRLKDLGYV